MFDWNGNVNSNFEVVQPAPLAVSTPMATPTSVTTPTPVPAKTGDINKDGYINMEDLILIDKAFNTINGNVDFNPDCDLNGDTAVNMADKMVFCKYLKETIMALTVSGNTNVPVSPPQSQNTISMNFDTTQINTVGQVICATLQVNNISGLAGYQAYIQYDPEVLQPVTSSGRAYSGTTQPENGTLFQNINYTPVGIAFNDITNGRLYIANSYSDQKNYKNNGPEENTGSLGVIRFKVLQVKDTNIIFRNTNNSLNEKFGVVLSDWDGEVISNYEVVQPSTLTASSAGNPTITPVNSSITWTLTPTPTATLTPTATPTLTPTLNPTPTSTPWPIKNYDINGDGYINMEDGQLIEQAYNTVAGEPNYNSACDLNNDSVVNMGDMMLLLAYLSKYTPPVSTISDTPCPTNITHTPLPTSESTWTPTPTPASSPTGL